MEDYIVSARKYRPMSFETVVGQQTLTSTLQNAIRQNHLAHAYLFCGPRGVGKTTCARIFAKTINCLHPTAEYDACNECESCRAFNEQRSFNIHELDAASNNSVEDIRSLIEEVRIPPQLGKYSVYIIDEVHMLSSAAFNALLKTLEEPPAHAIFILATTEKHKILPTILSRCQVYDFARITIGGIIGNLQQIAAKEGITVSEEALNVVAQKADGGMRDALSIFDQLVSFCGKEITYERAIEVLNVLDTEYYFRLTDFALRNDVSGALLLLNEVLKKGFDAGNFINGFAQHLRNVLVSKDPQTVQLLETSDAIRQHYAQQAQQCPPLWIFRALEILNTCDINYRTARNKRLTVELALVKLVAPVQQVSAPQPMPQAAPQTAAQPAQAPQAARPAQQTAPARPAQQPARPAATPRPTPAQQPPKAAPQMPSIPSIPTIPQVPPQGSVPAPATQTPANATPQPAAPQTNRNNPFTDDQFRDAWIGLATHFAEEPRLQSLIKDYAPRYTGSTHIQATMPNPWQLDLLKRNLPAISQLLHDQLQNDAIEIELTLAEYTREQMAFTDEEKYKVMLTENPALGVLKSKLDLQLD